MHKKMAFFSSSKFRKIVCAIVVLALVMPASFFMSPEKAEAGSIFTNDLIAIPTRVLNALSNVMKKLKDWGLDSIVWQLSSAVLKQLTADLVDWINSGFEGNPAFIDQPEYFFLDLADQVAGDFLFKNEDLRFLCDPLGMGMDIRGILAVGATSRFASFRYRSSCRLSQVFGNFQRANLFINGDFQVGGWTGWHSLTQIRGNNIFGATNIAMNESVKLTSNKTSGESTILNWGQGFFPTRDQEGFAKTPGVFIESQLSNSFGSNLEKLGLADELNEILNALMSQLLQQTVQSGLVSLSTRSSTQANSYSARLRTGDPAAPFRRLTDDERSQYKALSSADESESQESFDQAFAKAEAEAQAAYGEGEAKPNAKVLTTNAFTQQTCTASFNSNGAASLAIDGSSSSFSATGCIDGAQNTEHWWEVIFANSSILDEIRIESLSTGAGLRPISCVAYPGGCGNENLDSTYSYIAPSYTRPGATTQVIAPRMVLTHLNATGDKATSTKYLATPAELMSMGHEIINVKVLLDPPLNVTSAKIFSQGSDRWDDGTWYYGVNLREVTFYQHLVPIIKTDNFPTVIDPYSSATVSPLNKEWLEVSYYPRWDIDPTPKFNATQLVTCSATKTTGCMEVVAKDSRGNFCLNEDTTGIVNPPWSLVCTRIDDTPTYSFTPGNSFSIELVAIEPRDGSPKTDADGNSITGETPNANDGLIFRSKPAVKSFTVPPYPQ